MRCLSHCLHNVIKKACTTPLIESDIKLLWTLCKEIKKSSILSGQLANLAHMLMERSAKLCLTASGAGGIH